MKLFISFFAVSCWFIKVANGKTCPVTLVAKTMPSGVHPIKAGRMVLLRVTIKNKSQTELRNLALKIELPWGGTDLEPLKFHPVQIGNSPWGGSDPEKAGVPIVQEGNVYWTNINLKPGRMASFKVKARVNACLDDNTRLKIGALVYQMDRQGVLRARLQHRFPTH